MPSDPGSSAQQCATSSTATAADNRSAALASVGAALQTTEPDRSGMMLILVVNTSILGLVASVAFAAVEIVIHIWA